MIKALAFESGLQWRQCDQPGPKMKTIDAISLFQFVVFFSSLLEENRTFLLRGMVYDRYVPVFPAENLAARGMDAP